MKFLLFLSLLVAGLVSSAEMPDFPFIEVSGKAEREVKPTEVEISFQVKAFHKESKGALLQLEAYFGGVLAVLKEYELDEKKLEANEVRKSEVRKREGRNELEVLGYDVKQSVTLKMDDLEHYSSMMRSLIELDGVTSLDSDFDVSNRKELEAELVKEACQNARLKATQLAEGMGEKLGSVFAINGDGAGFVHWKSGSALYSAGLLPSLSGGGVERKKLFFIPESIPLSSRMNAIFRIE